MGAISFQPSAVSFMIRRVGSGFTSLRKLYHCKLQSSRLTARSYGRFRDECLNEHWFLSLPHARNIVEEWRVDYNLNRPHSSHLTPEEFRLEHKISGWWRQDCNYEWTRERGQVRMAPLCNSFGINFYQGLQGMSSATAVLARGT